MPKFQFKDGKTLEFEEFPIKEANLRKINIVRDGTDSEGVWAAFPDEGLKKYDKHYRSTTYEGVCILQNAPLHFLPSNGWGAYVPVKFNGGTRPVLDMAHMTGKMLFCKERQDIDAKQNKEEQDNVHQDDLDNNVKEA